MVDRISEFTQDRLSAKIRRTKGTQVRLGDEPFVRRQSF